MLNVGKTVQKPALARDNMKTMHFFYKTTSGVFLRLWREAPRNFLGPKIETPNGPQCPKAVRESPKPCVWGRVDPSPTPSWWVEVRRPPHKAPKFSTPRQVFPCSPAEPPPPPTGGPWARWVGSGQGFFFSVEDPRGGGSGRPPRVVP